MKKVRQDSSPLLDATEYRETLSNLLVSLFGDTGMRLSVCDLSGNSIGVTNNRGEFCDYVYNSSLEQRCHRCTRRGIETVQQTRQPFSYRCHMGLVSTLLPIMQGNTLIGCLLFSGYRMEPEAMQALDAMLPDANLEINYPELYAKFDTNPFFPRQRIQEFIRMLSVAVEHLSRVNEHTQTLIDLQGKSLELLTNANIREQQEKKKVKTDYKILENRVQDQFLFDAMGHLSALATLEHNDEMAELLQDLAVVGQKVRHPYDMVVLGEKIVDLNRYFHLLRSMYDGRVQFQVVVDSSCQPDCILMQLPFGTLIDILLREMLSQENPQTPCAITISLAEQDHTLRLGVSIDIGVMSAALVQQFRQLYFPSGDLEGLLFKKLIDEQKQYYGPDVRWDCVCKPGKLTELALYLPLKEVPSN